MKVDIETTALVPISRDPAPSIVQKIINLLTERGTAKMKRIEIKDQLSHDQERELFKKFYDALPKGANLKTLLKGFDGYLDQQLNKGLPLDNPLARIQQLEKDLLGQKAALITKDTKIADQERYINNLMEDAKANLDEINNKEERIKDIHQAAAAAAAQAHEASSKLEALELENLKLKGKLYDILTKE